MAYTPGPWVTADTKFANGIRTEVEAAGESGPICACIRTVNARKVRSWNEVDANAKLIAAAPELLAACHSLLSILNAELEDDPNPSELTSWLDAINKANKAIDKAEGKVK